MTDRERILTIVIQRLLHGSLSNRFKDGHKEEDWKPSPSGILDTHFAWYAKPAPQPGDLVVAWTGHACEWTVGWYVEKLPGDYAGALIREIGSRRTCRYSNEEFIPIRGLYPNQLLEGARYQTYVKLQKAFAKVDDWNRRFGGVDFEGTDPMETKGTLRAWVRERYGGALSGEGESKPFAISIPWTRTMSIKTLAAALVEGGMLTREFERVPKEVVS